MKFLNKDERNEDTCVGVSESEQANAGAGAPVRHAQSGDGAPGVQGDVLVNIEDFAKVVITVGEIKACEKVEGSSKLYRLSVDMGEPGSRQILAGIAKSYAPEELIGRKGAFISNLQPREMAGTVSQGMILCATDSDGKPKMLSVDPSAPNGSRIR